MLERIGYTVDADSSGEAALDFVKKRKPDLIVLDMIMAPGMDGLETYQAIIDLHPDQKAIITSGYSETDRVRKTQILGAGAYVRKPELIDKIAKAVRDELDRAD